MISKDTMTISMRILLESGARLARPLVLALAVTACGVGGAEPAGNGPAGTAGGDVAPAGLPGAGGAHPAPDTVDLRTIGYSRGPDDAPVQVYEFSDFGCPYCSLFAELTYPELHEEYVATGKVRWTYVPFVLGIFPNGAEAARAAECAGEQDRFWEMHDRLYEGQRDWKSSRNPASIFTGYAAELGLDADRFGSCYGENSVGRRTTLNNRVAAALGVRATPTFIVNGRLVQGAVPADQFRLILHMSGAR